MHIKDGVFMPTEYVMRSTSDNCQLLESPLICSLLFITLTILFGVVLRITENLVFNLISVEILKSQLHDQPQSIHRLWAAAYIWDFIFWGN